MSSKKGSVGLVKLARKYRVRSGLTAELVETYFSSLDCPRSLALWIMFRENEHDQLAAVKFNPLDYDNLVEFRSAYLATKYLSKFDSLNLTVEKDKAAWTKFREFEARCGIVNSRFRIGHQDSLFKGPVVWLHHAVKRKIAQILGDFDAEEMVQRCSWGPGASTTIRRRDASASKKFQCETGITRDLYALLPKDLLQVAYPAWIREMNVRSGKFNSPGVVHEFCAGNKVITVPKDSSIDRIIAVEPGWNLWFQMGIGRCINKRLLRNNVNLQDQSINQGLARSGSITGLLTTVDLSSASDSIAYELVRELIPSDWFSVMDSCRSHYGYIGDELIKWNKFSSMGNGFTFPLESLIFYAAAQAAVEYTGSEGRASVYGDDVILPTSAYPVFSLLLEYYGFLINQTKSFSYSWFRESCGAHWYRGVDVRPIYLKGRIKSVLAVYRAANSLRRLAHRSSSKMACDANLRPGFDLLVASVPRLLRLRIPETLGDGGFISNFDEASPALARSRKLPWLEGFKVPNLVSQVDLVHDDSPGYLLARLWGMSMNGPARDIQQNPTTSLKKFVFLTNLRDFNWDDSVEYQGRNSTPTHRKVLSRVESVVQQWYDLGPWI